MDDASSLLITGGLNNLGWIICPRIVPPQCLNHKYYHQAARRIEFYRQIILTLRQSVSSVAQAYLLLSSINIRCFLLNTPTVKAATKIPVILDHLVPYLSRTS
jgi:hypothetical protein